MRCAAGSARWRLTWLAGVVAVLATGCPQVPDDVPGAAIAPVELTAGVVFRNPARHRLEVLQATKPSATLKSLDYRGAPDWQVVTADGARVLWLESAARKLTASDGLTVQNYPLAAEFGAALPSDDGHVAALIHPEGGSAASSLVNTDEVALVDLDKPAAANNGNPKVATISGLGRAPLRARVAPPITAADGVHRLMWVEARGRVGLCDFGPSGAVRTAVVPLAANPQSQIAPIRSLVLVGAGRADIYLLADALNDVMHIAVNLGPTALDVSLDQIAAGADPLDLYVYESKGALRVLVANNVAASLSILDPATGSGIEIPLQSAVSRLRMIPAADGKQRVVAWAADQLHADAYIVDLDDLDKKKGKAVRRVLFDQSVVDLLPVAGKVLVRHTGSAVGLSLLDVISGTSTQFAGTGNLTALRVVETPGGAAAWLLGSASAGARLSRIDLTTLHGDSVTFNAAGQGLFRVGSSVMAYGWGLGGWWAAVFPDGPVDAKKASWFEGFTLQGWLDGGAP